MSQGSKNGDGTLFTQRETSHISSLQNEFPASTNVLVVEPSFITLLKMKKIMIKYGYQVMVYADAESALAFLRSCEHEINIVIWDFHMPGINGLQALKIICTEMDLPVVIMSDDDRTASVMKATIHGACDYVLKPVRKEIIANIWQHIVRKKMMGHNHDGFKEDKDDSMNVDQYNNEQNINMIGEKSAKKPQIGETLPIQSDWNQSIGLDQDNSDSWSQYNGDQNIDIEEGEKPKTRMEWTKDLQEKFLEAVDYLGGAKKANPKPLLNMLKDMGVKGLTRSNVCSHLQKYRLSLQEKQQTPQQMQEFDWSNSCSTPHLLGLNNVHTATSSIENDRATYPTFKKNQYQNRYMEVKNNHAATSSLMNGGITYPAVQQNQYQNGYMEVHKNHAASSSRMNCEATYPAVQENQYQNGYVGVNNNQVMTSTMPHMSYDLDHCHYLQKQQLEEQHHLSNQLKHIMSEKEPEKSSSIDTLEDLRVRNTMLRLPYDLRHENHHQQQLEQQQHQLPHQWNNVMSTNEPELVSGNGVTGLEEVIQVYRMI